MRKREMKKIIIASVLTLIASTATAEEVASTDTSFSGLYLGGGLSYNNLDFGSVVSGASNKTATGFQLFAGLPLSNAISGIKTYAELGLFQTKKFNFSSGGDDVKGISGSVVLEKDLSEIDPRFYALARLGLEVGDDDGIFMGIGAGFRVTPKVELRAEFVNKDLITSYQANALIRF